MEEAAEEVAQFVKTGDWRSALLGFSRDELIRARRSNPEQRVNMVVRSYYFKDALVYADHLLKANPEQAKLMRSEIQNDEHYAKLG
jgi:hypothetical protein